METLTIDLRACDIGMAGASPEEVVRSIICQTIDNGWDKGSDIVVFPEFYWMTLERFVTDSDKCRGVARLFWNEIWPGLQLDLFRKDKAVVLGSVPCELPDGSLRNRSPILYDGRVLFQDKLNLTPWETAFTPGETLTVWTFRGARLAVLVCLDIEVPELAVALRKSRLDALLVPSATESIEGLERIGRCAMARSTELSCFVGVAHLTGSIESELVDKNFGRAAWFSPSQAAFRAMPKVTTTNCVWKGHERLVGNLDLSMIAASRADHMETNPVHLTPRPVIVLEAND